MYFFIIIITVLFLQTSPAVAEYVRMVKDINPNAQGSNPYYLTNVNNTLYFIAADKEDHYDLWKTDGTRFGTGQIIDINPDYSSHPEDLTNVNDWVYFSADNSFSVRYAIIR